MTHKSFLAELVGKLGAPIFAGTLVACLLQRQLDPLHGVLLLTGICLLAVDHWNAHHKRPRDEDAARH